MERKREKEVRLICICPSNVSVHRVNVRKTHTMRPNAFSQSGGGFIQRRRDATMCAAENELQTEPLYSAFQPRHGNRVQSP